MKRGSYQREEYDSDGIDVYTPEQRISDDEFEAPEDQHDYCPPDQIYDGELGRNLTPQEKQDMWNDINAPLDQDPYDDIREEDYMPRAQMKKEQEQKSKQGIMSRTLEAATKISAAARSVPILAEVASVATPIFKFAHDIARGLGLDYPRDISNMQRLIVQQTSSFSYGRGTDASESIAFDPQNQVSNDQSFFAEKNGPSSLFTNYQQRPGLIKVTNFDATATAGQIITTLPINPINMNNNQADDIFTINCTANVAANFRYWRGSMKYLLMFTTSKFVSCRIRIEWLPDPTLTALVTDSSAGDIVSLTVDINGDTDVPFTVPYLKDTMWLVVPAPNVLKAANVAEWQDVCNGSFTLRVVNPPISSTSATDAVVDVAIFSAAGEDMQFARPTEIWPNFLYSADTGFKKTKKTEEKEEIKEEKKEIKIIERKTELKTQSQTPKSSRFELHAQMATSNASVQDRFKTVFQPLAPAKFSAQKNILQGEEVCSWPELMHRYHLTQVLVIGSALEQEDKINPWFPIFMTSYETALWSRFMNSFNFHRGNFRAKFVLMDASVSNAMYLSNCVTDPLNTVEGNSQQTPASKGMTYNDSVFRKNMEVEVPFYGIVPFACQQYAIERYELPCVQLNISNYSVAAPHIVHNYFATGDNYSCGVPMPPGYFTITALHAQMMQDTGAHGNEERKVVETVVQENTQLTSFRDQVGVKEDENDQITNVHSNTDPYGDQGLTQVLSRKYIIQQVTWNNTQNYGTLVASGDSPRELFNIDKIQETLNRFKYMRAGTEIEMRLNSTTFHSGKLFVVYCPHWNPNNSNSIASLNDMYSLSCFDSMTISACANETVRFVIPYVAPSSYFDLQQDYTLSTFTGFFGCYKVFVLAPLRLVGEATASLTLTIYASFVHPEVAGFIPKDTLSARPLRRTENVHIQSSNKNSTKNT